MINSLNRIIYDLSIIPKVDFSIKLYKKYEEMLVNFLSTIVHTNLKTLEGIELLKALNEYWDKYINIFVKWLKKCFIYLD
jgi:hypothetical protein